MRRVLIILGALFVVSVISAPSAVAASPHFKRGGSPTCTISGGAASKSTTCTATLAGLGNDDLLVTTSTSGFALYQCQNAGGNVAPGQNRVLVGPVTSTTSIPGDQIKNGNLTFFTNPAVLTAAPTVSAAVAGCPNPNWSGVNPTVTVTDITLVIEQPPGTVLFTCTASDPNGLSGTVALSC
ncbi:MAG TPA: hypothetical protein VF109_08675 [Mycobacteriales bacterium]